MVTGWESACEVTCVECGIVFSVPVSFVDERQKDGATFFCPNGHKLTYGETELDRLKKDNKELKGKLARYTERLAGKELSIIQLKLSLAATRAWVTRLKGKKKSE